MKRLLIILVCAMMALGASAESVKYSVESVKSNGLPIKYGEDVTIASMDYDETANILNVSYILENSYYGKFSQNDFANILGFTFGMLMVNNPYMAPFTMRMKFINGTTWQIHSEEMSESDIDSFMEAMRSMIFNDDKLYELMLNIDTNQVAYYDGYYITNMRLEDNNKFFNMDAHYDASEEMEEALKCMTKENFAGMGAGDGLKMFKKCMINKGIGVKFRLFSGDKLIKEIRLTASELFD